MQVLDNGVVLSAIRNWHVEANAHGYEEVTGELGYRGRAYIHKQ